MTRARRSMLLAGVFALGALGVLLWLGAWQVERKFWKEELIAVLTQRSSAAPQPLPQGPAASQQAESEFRHVVFRAEFLPGKTPQQRDREARVYTGGAALRDDIKEPGYFVFAPARLADGRVVVVNRGYVANPRPNAETPLVAQPEGPIEITGVMRWPERKSMFAAEYSVYEDLWFVRDHLGMALRNNWGAVEPYYIEQEAPVPAGGVPKPAPLKVNLPNHHLQYALTWFGLAVVLVVMFGIWAWSRRRDDSAGR